MRERLEEVNGHAIKKGKTPWLNFCLISGSSGVQDRVLIHELGHAASSKEGHSDERTTTKECRQYMDETAGPFMWKSYLTPFVDAYFSKNS